MKITKKQPIKANEDVTIADVWPTPDVVADTPVVTEPATCKYACAIDCISNAIECLAEVAKDDQIAKDSIANLGVVLLDLKGSC